MKMKKKPFRNILLVLAVASIANLLQGADAIEYPDEVSPFTMKYGCLPWVDGQCPARMICYIDITYAYWGQCGCSSGWHHLGTLAMN